MAKYKFGEIVKEVKEKVDRNNNPYDYFIAGDHMDTDELHLLRRGTFKGSDVGPAFIRIFKPGQVLYGSRRTYLRKVAVADFEGVTANTTFVLESKDESVLLQRLLPFIMQADRFVQHSIKHSKGSTNPYVLFSDLADFEFELPDMAKQKELAEILWAMDATKRAYQKLLAATDELVKAQFVEMFGNPITNDRGWDFACLSELTDIVLGTTPKSSEPAYWDGNIKWITPAEIDGKNLVINDSVRHITEAGVKAAGLKSFPAGTVIFSTRAPIGKSAIAGCEMYCNQGFKNFVCRPRINPLYLLALLRIYKDYFIGLGTGATFKELSKARLEKVFISAPPIELQEKFAAFVRQSDKAKSELERTLSELTATYKRIIAENLG